MKFNGRKSVYGGKSYLKLPQINVLPPGGMTSDLAIKTINIVYTLICKRFSYFLYLIYLIKVKIKNSFHQSDVRDSVRIGRNLTSTRNLTYGQVFREDSLLKN